MSRRLFINDVLEQHYQDKGYAVIDFIDETQVAKLKALYSQHYVVSPTGFFASQYDPNDLAKQEIYQTILEICSDNLTSHFYEAEPFIASFLVKKANSNSEVSPHLDWTFVDEKKYSSVTVWCPLVDCDEQNGTLEVVEGSHRLMDTLRGSPQLPFPYFGYDLYSYTKQIPIKAGQAVVYNHSAIHASKNNNSNADRIATGIGLKPKEADLFHVHLSPDGKLKKYRASADFFHQFSYGSAPDEQYFQNVINFEFKTMSESELRQKLGWPEKMPIAQPIVAEHISFFTSLWQKLFG